MKGGLEIDYIEIRCKGKLKNGEPCHRKFYVGSPGFDISGNPKVQIVKCPVCHNYMIITSRIREETLVIPVGKIEPDQDMVQKELNQI
jgi:hypothetical protein